MGRPSKCTPETTRKIADLVGQGVPPLTAARACGVAERTFQQWLQRAAQADQLGVDVPQAEVRYVRFAREIGEAAAEHEAGLVAMVIAHARSGAPDSWRAARWLLERRYRGNWAESRSAGAPVSEPQAPARPASVTSIVQAARATKAAGRG